MARLIRTACAYIAMEITSYYLAGIIQRSVKVKSAKSERVD